MDGDLSAWARDHGVRYFLVSFTDLGGVQRTKLVPAQAIGQMQAEGAGFAGFATHLDLSPADADVMAMPDPASVTPIPWKPGFAWVAADCTIEGAPLPQAPRVVLKAQMAAAAAQGLTVKTGVEPEFFLLTPDGAGVSDPFDTAAKPCYDQQMVMRRVDLIAEISDHMIALGWGPYQSDHEDANGQFEMNWLYADALTTADRHSFFKFMVKSVAERHGFRASFMPKPFAQLTGSGCHIHVSVWRDDANAFADDGAEFGLAQAGRWFLCGMLRHARGLSLITNPVVNSYKRINAPRTASGATWAPNTISWAGNNRTHMIRIPGPGRFELRLPDAAANPYLLQAGVIAAGLSGLAARTDPGPAAEGEIWGETAAGTAHPLLPGHLGDALAAFGADTVLTGALGTRFTDAYAGLKAAEWRAYLAHLSPWERDTTLDI